MKKRDDTFDVMKAVAIILVIIGHCNISDELRLTIFSFHMPLFFIISGYFYRPSGTKEVILKSYRRLLIPYVITGVATSMLFVLAGNTTKAISRGIGILFGNNGSPEAMYHMPMCGAVWFLLALFWCRVIFSILQKKTKHWFIWCMILSVCSSAFGHYVVNPPFGILIGMTALVFFSIGVLFQNIQIKFSMIAACIALWVVSLMYGKLEMAIYRYQLYPIVVFGSLGGGVFGLLYIKTNLSICLFEGFPFLYRA